MKYCPLGEDVGCPLAQWVYEMPLPSVHTKRVSQLMSFMPIHKSWLYCNICVVRNARRKKQYALNLLKWWNINFAGSQLWTFLTLLFLTQDGNQISSLVYAVGPGILPAHLVSFCHNFIALCEQDEIPIHVRITKGQSLTHGARTKEHILQRRV